MSNIETSPILRNDPLWSALENAKTILRHKPQWLRERKPDWEGGLNSITLNRLAREAGIAAHAVIEEEKRANGPDGSRWLVFRHSEKNVPPIEVKIWSSIGGSIEANDEQLKDIVAFIQSWQDARTEQLGIGLAGHSNAPGDKAESLRHNPSFVPKRGISGNARKLYDAIVQAQPDQPHEIFLDDFKKSPSALAYDAIVAEAKAESRAMPPRSTSTTSTPH